MDLTNALNKKPKSFNKSYLVLIVICVVALLLVIYLEISDKQHVEKNELRIAQVTQGDFKVNVSGYGRLKAKYQRLLTNQSQAIVESILLYPGAKVNKDTVIMTLTDPQLEQAVIMSETNELDVSALSLNHHNKSNNQNWPLLTLEESEKRTLITAIKHYQGNVIEAGEFLGISKSAIYRRLEKFAIDPKLLEC